MVLACVSKSRRWRCLSTPSTSVSSVERYQAAVDCFGPVTAVFIYNYSVFVITELISDLSSCKQHVFKYIYWLILFVFVSLD
jgi:hypothetical protein